LSIPNLITLARILAVPVILWAITSGEMRIAFALFLAAGLSDLIDGFLAKRFGMATELGAYLDPLADKAMIVSIYVALGIVEAMPRWLVILVVSRDIMIVSAVILSWLVDRPVKLKPLTVSKLNTVAQIIFATVVLAALAFRWEIPLVINALIGLVAVLTLVPTPSVVATRTGSAKPARLRSNRPPKPPISASAPGRAVARTNGLIRSTMRLPASISTPASA